MTAASRPTPGRFRVPQGLARWARPLLLATFATATIAVLADYVFPTRTWLDQREALAETSAELSELRAEREALQARIDQLDSDAEIEAIARSEYGLVLPGEEAYAVHPAPEPPIELPAVWPFGELLPERSSEPVAPTP